FAAPQAHEDVDPLRVVLGLLDVSGRRVGVGVRVAVPAANDLVAPVASRFHRRALISAVDPIRDRGRGLVPARPNFADDTQRLTVGHGPDEQPARFVREAVVAVPDDRAVLVLREPERRGSEAHAAQPVAAGASRIARHTRSDVSGMSTWRIPKIDSASTTAFWAAGVEPIVPASPIPFAPSGLSGVGVSVFEASKLGSSAALGIA